MQIQWQSVHSHHVSGHRCSDMHSGRSMSLLISEILFTAEIAPGKHWRWSHTLSHEYQLRSVLGNHDHAFLNGIQVSGSDPASMYRHEQIRNSPLLSIFDNMPMEWSDQGMLFVHGGPLDLGNQTLRLKCWQRLSHEAGDSFAGYNYTASMAFDALEARGFTNMCCGHQHQNICCHKTPDGIVRFPIEFEPLEGTTGGGKAGIEVARTPLNLPSLLRVGGCHGDEPEFAYTDFSTFSFIRISSEDW